MKAKIYKINPTHPEQTIINLACEFLKEGSVIAYPTETYYGLGVHISNESALEKIFKIKGRKLRKPLPLLIPHKKILKELTVEIPHVAEILMEKFWPGALTLIFWASSQISPLITGGTQKVGVRISSNPIAQAIVSSINAPLTATSANLSGNDACKTAQEVSRMLGNKLDLIIDGGQTNAHQPSTILDLTQSPPQILREGIIPFKKIAPYLLGTPLYDKK